jgi:hypothetical protein
VIVASTHNHQGPDTIGYWGPAMLYVLPYRTGIDVRYVRALESRIALAVERAVKSAQPAQLRFAKAELPPHLVKNLRKPEELDLTIEILSADGPSGQPIASLVDYACHPEMLGPRAHLLSADFPGALTGRLEQLGMGQPIFANGALGGMITGDIDEDADDRERSAFIERAGESVAQVVRAARDSARSVDVESILVASKTIELPVDNDIFELIGELGLIERRQKKPGGGIEVEVWRMDLGPARIVTVPGEPTPRVGGAIKRALGGEHPILIGLGNDEIGYILDPIEYADDRYDYERSVSLGPKTAPLLEQAIAALRPS